MSNVFTAAARFAAIVAVAIAATTAGAGIARAGDGPRVVSLKVCIDGLDISM